ncbi:MAG: protein-glutamate O-methyltransferase CheR [Clostridia bacterium]|nr:protein-glutamate O-methyltransferase CheR [Clostridia bacterium]
MKFPTWGKFPEGYSKSHQAGVDDEMVPSLSSKEFYLFQKYIEEQCGICIGQDKAYLIESRLSKLLVDSGLPSFEALYQKIRTGRDKSIAEKVVDAITTNETLWFRDKIPWQTMEDLFLPKYIKDLREGKKSEIKIWSAACSTGQEPYSTAMFIDHYLQSNNIKDIRLSQFKILATDISSTVLEVAKMGKYDSISIMRGLHETYKTDYFKNEGRVWHLSENIKAAVQFKQFNLQSSFLFLGKFDMIFCRYVMIYFSDIFKKEVLSKIASALNPGGVMFIGSSELFNDYKENFHMKQHKTGVYYEVKG